MEKYTKEVRMVPCSRQMGSAVASWLVRLTLDRVVWVPRPGQGNCVVFLGKTLDSHCASLHPGLQMGTGKFNAGGNLLMD